MALISGYGLQVAYANIHMGMDVSGVVSGSQQINNHFGRTIEKTKRAVNQFGYMYLALQRIATYTAIFSFFATLVKLMGQVVELQTRQAEVATLVDMRNERLKASYNRVITTIQRLPPHLGSAIDLTKGLYEIMSAGVSEPEEAMKLLIVSAKYAKAGLTDLATAASTATAVMKAYGLSADQMKSKLDVMFGAVMEGKFHTADLNEALGTVLPTAAAMGVSIEEVSMALAVLSQRGLDARQAATGLNRMLLAWMKPLDKSRKEFNKLGLEFGRNAFATKSFGEQLAIIQRATERYGDLLPNIFTRQRGLRAAFILTGTGLKDYNILMDRTRSLTEEGGEVNRASIKIQETVADKLKAMRNEMLQVASSWLKYHGAAVLGVEVTKIFATGLIRMLPFMPLLAGGHVLFTKLIQRQSTQMLIAAKVIDKYRMMGRGLSVEQSLHLMEQKALYDQGLKNARMWKTLRLGMLGALAAGIITHEIFVRLNKALERQAKFLKEWGDAVAESSRKTSAMRAVIEDVRGDVSQYGETVKKITYQLVVAEIGRLKKANLDWFDSWMKIEKVLKRIWKSGDVRKLEYDFMTFVRAVFEGKATFKEFGDIALLMGKGLGYWRKAQDEANAAYARTTDVGKRYNQVLREAMLLMRDIPDLAEAINQHPITLAEMFEMDKLESMKKTIETLLNPEFDPMVAAQLKKMGDAYVNLIPSLKMLKERMDEALKEKALLDYLRGVEEFRRQYTQQLDKLAPSVEQLERMTVGMAKAWKTYLERGITDVKRFVRDNREAVEIIRLNWNKLPKETQQSLQKFVNVLIGGERKMEALREQAIKGIKGWGETLQKVLNDIQEMENKYLDDKNANIVLKAKEENMILANKLREQYALYEKAIGSNLYMYAAYGVMKLAMLKKEQTAEKLMRKENLNDFMDKQKDIMSNDLLTVAQRLKFARYMYDNFDEYATQFGFKTKEELEHARELWEKFWKAIIDGLNKVKTPLTAWIEGFRLVSQWLSSSISMIRDWADALGISGSALERVLGAMETAQKGAANLANSIKLIEWSQSDAADKAGGFMKALAGIGGHIGAVISVATTAIGIFKKLFGGKSEEEKARERAEQEQKKMENWVKWFQKTMGVFGDVSDNTAKAVYELTKKGMPEFVAVAKSLNQIMQDTGVNMQNFALYTQRASDVLHQAGNEWFTMEEAARVFGEAFSKLVDYAKEMGIEGSKSLIDMIRRSRELGVEVKEVTEYVQEQLKAGVGGLFKMIEAVGTEAVNAYNAISQLSEEEKNLYQQLKKLQDRMKDLKVGSDAWLEAKKKVDKLMQTIKETYPELYRHIKTIEEVAEATGGRLENLAVLTAGVFASMVGSGMSAVDILAVMGDALGALKERYEILGQDVPAYLQPIFNMYDAMAKFPKKFEGFQGMLDLLNALGNSAFLTQEMFDALLREGRNYYNWLTKTQDKGGAGLPDEDAIRMLYPMLQQAWWYAEQYGLKLPKWMEDAIDKAKGFGLKFEKPAVDQQIDILKDLTYKAHPDLYRLTEAGFKDVTDAVRGLGAHGYQMGTPYIPYTHVAKLHAGESIIPANLAGALREFFSGSRSGLLEGGMGGGMAQVHVHVDGRLLYKAIVPFLREGGNYSDYELGGEGVR